MTMQISINKGTVSELENLSAMTREDVSDIIYAIEAAPDMESLRSLMPGEVVMTARNEFHILIYENYQYVRMCISR